MRKAEALNLTWDRVDLRQAFIKLLGTGTKTGEGRLVPISPRLKAVLKKIREREKVGKVVKLTERVFLFKRKPFARFDRAFKTACKKAGIEGLWVHDLRASFATRKISEGFDRDWVKMITGHRTDHVFRRYNRPSPEALRVCEKIAVRPSTSSGQTAKYLNFHLRHAVRGEPFDFAQDRRVEP